MTEQSQPVRLGVIGGSGLYQIDGLKDARRLIDGVERRYLNDDEDEDEDRPEG